MAMSTLKQQFLELSEPDADGVYRNGSAKRMARTNLAMRELEALWNEAVHSVPFQIPDSGIGLAAVGSLARGQIGPASDLDLVLITADHVALSTTQLNEFANKLWYPIWDSGLNLDHSVRTVSRCESVTDHDLPAAMGWLNVNPIAGDRHLIETTATAILERWRKAARKRLPELLESANVRNERFDRMSYVNQPDIKESRGGLRDTVLLSALAASWLADRPHGRYDDAVERLLDVRDAIHLITRKDADRLLTQYQAEVAAMLGLTDPTLPEGEREAKSIDDLQTLLASLSRTIAFRPPHARNARSCTTSRGSSSSRFSHRAPAASARRRNSRCSRRALPNTSRRSCSPHRRTRSPTPRCRCAWPRPPGVRVCRSIRPRW